MSRAWGGADPMEVRVVDPRDLPGWDQGIARHPGASVFHTVGWASVLAETYGFRPRYLQAQRKGHLEGLLPLMEVRGWRCDLRGVGLPFTDCCPMLLPADDDDRDLVGRCFHAPSLPGDRVSDQLLAAAAKLAGERRWRTLELRPATNPSDPALASVTFVRHEVPLVESDEGQERLCAAATRRSLRQGRSANLPVRLGTDPGLVRGYYSLHCVTRRRQGAPPQPWRFFENLRRHLLTEGQGFVVLVGDPAVAGMVFLRFGTRAVYKFGASDGRLLETRPNQIAMWTGLRHAAKTGCGTMDLGRTSGANEGLRRFKSSWGGLETQLMYHCLDIRHRRVIALPDQTQGWQVRWFRRLPIWVSRVVGSVAYRYAA